MVARKSPTSPNCHQSGRYEQHIEWLIDGIIPLGSVTLISGESGVGKTWLAYAIAGAVARGESFAGLKVQQSARCSTSTAKTRSA